jgi:hypothetical protein
MWEDSRGWRLGNLFKKSSMKWFDWLEGHFPSFTHNKIPPRTPLIILSRFDFTKEPRTSRISLGELFRKKKKKNLQSMPRYYLFICTTSRQNPQTCVCVHRSSQQGNLIGDLWSVVMWMRLFFIFITQTMSNERFSSSLTHCFAHPISEKNLSRR